MRAVVVYESMYGNTHLIAEAIASGLRGHGEVACVAVGEADPALVANADLVVVGGPTHAHGMSHAKTREAAAQAAHKPDATVDLDPDAEGPGLRDWFDRLDDLGDVAAAAFDTRFDMPKALTGRASKGIARRLHRRGAQLVAEPESFLVTKDQHLEPHEEERARAWGGRLGLGLDVAAHHA